MIHVHAEVVRNTNSAVEKMHNFLCSIASKKNEN